MVYVLTDFSSNSRSEKLLKLNEFINKTEDGSFVLITMKSEVNGIEDNITRIYSKRTMKFHASSHVLMMVPDEENGGLKPFMSDKGTSMFCSDRTMEESLYQSLGDLRAFEEWAANSIDIFALTGKRYRDLYDGSGALDKRTGRSEFQWFFKKYKDEFMWAMSEGRKVYLERMANKEYDIPTFFAGKDYGKEE
jgi:hypothetical protein